MSVQSQFGPIEHLLAPILSNALEKLERQPDPHTIDILAMEMGKLFDYAKLSGQLPAFKSVCNTHLLMEIIREDPYSHRAIRKPRGFAGDAVMLDYIYRETSEDLSLRGRAIHSATTTLSTARSVLWRREYLADKLCKVSNGQQPGKVLSVASGHMRELELVRARSEKGEANLRIWALDQDRDALEECVRSNAAFSIIPINKSVRHVLKGNCVTEQFDLIYSAGLSDYLEDKVLLALVKALYRLLAPNGLLVIGNFSPSNHGRGFMEGFLDWSLKYRSERELMKIVQEALPCQPTECFSDAESNVAYVEARRA